MKAFEPFTRNRVSKKWVMAYLILTVFYPLMTNWYLLSFGEHRNGIIKNTKNPYVEEYLKGVNMNYDELGINTFLYTVNNEIYVGQTGLYNFGELNEQLELLVDLNNPEDYLVPSFRSIYFSPAGLNTFVGLFFMGIFIYVIKDR